jgi:nicotinate-nucleotide adenylyltransferase
MRPTLIYGGSFDPFHLGHLNTALSVQKYYHFERFIFLPCKIPVLKNATIASSEQRVHMVQLALKPYPQFTYDCREIERDAPSYMVDTLQSYRDELGKGGSLTLLLGMDAFLQLPKWHRWQDLLKLSHLLVINRLGIAVAQCPSLLKELLKTHETSSQQDILQKSHGHIYRFDAGHYDISSTWLRQQIKQGNAVHDYLPHEIADWVNDVRLYR